MQSFSQIYIMAVFGVKYRDAVINPLWRQNLYACIGKTLSDLDGLIPIEIGGTDDHVHVLYSSQGKVADTEIIRKIKSESSLWVNTQKLTRCKFAWQRGCARISYSPSSVASVKAYIQNQVQHHKNITFQQEYETMLRRAGLEPSEYNTPEKLL